MTTIATQLRSVEQSIAAACLRHGRAPGSVRLLAVSKTQGPEALRQAFAAGQRAFGENYVQEALAKMDALADLPIEWHCIGPLQSNKTRPVAERFDWVHSVERLKIAERLSEQRPLQLAPLQVCLQLNVDGGANKAGVNGAEAVALALAVAALPRLCLRGVMSIPEPAEGFAAQMELHQRAASLFAQIAAALARERPEALAAFDTLSLGMSADLEAAVAAGSTLVRVGTAIFGGRPPK